MRSWAILLGPDVSYINSSFDYHVSYLMLWLLILRGIGVAFVDSPSMSLLSYLASHHGVKNLGSIYALQDICISTGKTFWIGFSISYWGFAFGPLVGPSVSLLLGGNQDGFTLTAALGAFLMFAYFPFTFAVRTTNAVDHPFRELLLKSI